MGAPSSTADGALLAEQAQVLEAIVRDRPLSEVLAALCRIVERNAAARVRAAILLVDDSGKRLVTGAAPSLPETYNRAVDGVPISADVGTCAAAAALGTIVVTPDIANAPTWASLRDLPLGLGMVAAWSMPILSSTDAVLGTFGTYFFEKREPTDAERQLVAVVARTAALAIERARDVAARAAAEARLREQDRKKDEFLATLAHELRNPLAPIRTGLHLLGLAISDEEAARTRDRMERHLGHLVRLVDDLLDLSRVTLGRIELKKERVDLRAALESAIDATRSQLESRGHELTVDVPDEPLLVEADPTRIAQVFSNLVDNAAKYTPPGGHIRVEVEVEVAGEREPDRSRVRARVRDDGMGIAPEMLPDVFDMFTQGGQSIERPQGGLGIGLTLVRRLVEMHGGTGSAASDGAGRGSSFVVELPLAAAARAGEPESARGARGGRRASRGHRILVVDDNVDGAEMLAMLLEHAGNQTRLAHTGPAALVAAADFHPDVVFLDIGLPGIDGYEVAKRLRADPTSPKPYIVALTGWGAEEDRRQARSAGFDDHLVKPVDAAQVDAALERAQQHAAAE